MENYNFARSEKMWKEHIKGVKLSDIAKKYGIGMGVLADHISHYLMERSGRSYRRKSNKSTLGIKTT